MPKFTIEVTQEDIDQGQPRSAFHCPIAKALVRKFPGKKGNWIQQPFVSGDTATYCFWGLWRTSELPREVIERVKAYDGGAKLNPFTFQIELPKGWSR